MRTFRDTNLLYIGVVVALVPVMVLRDFTPDNELRYLSIADEALRQHAYFAFTNHGVPYADKPPLYLWIVMLLRWLTGAHRMWLLSLVSLLPALGVVQLMNRWCWQSGRDDSIALAAPMLLTSAFFMGAAVALRMDMLMCLFIVLALYTFWQRLTLAEAPKRFAWRFPVCLFLAVFTKGPLGLLIPFCATTVYLAVTHRLRLWTAFWGWRTWLVLLAGMALWLGAVYAEGGSAYLYNLTVHQTVDRAVHSFHHSRGALYYVGSIWYIIAPWSLLVLGTVAMALRRWKTACPLQQFFLTVGVVTFVLLSCISGKLQIYLLPALPFLIYGAALSLGHAAPARWQRVALGVPCVALALALPAVCVAVRMGVSPLADVIPVYVAAAILSIGGVATLVILGLRATTDMQPRAVRSLVATLLLAVYSAGWAVPHLNRQIGYGTVCHSARWLSARYDTSRFYTWRISRADNIDVYLQHPVSTVPDSLLPPRAAGWGYVLITDTASARSLGARQVEYAGPYAAVVWR